MDLGGAELESTLKESQDSLEPHPRGGASFQHIQVTPELPTGLGPRLTWDYRSKLSICSHSDSKRCGDPVFPSLSRDTEGCSPVFREHEALRQPCLAFRVYVMTAPPKSRASVIRPFLLVLKT